jgi:hypothetical protein
MDDEEIDNEFNTNKIELQDDEENELSEDFKEKIDFGRVVLLFGLLIFLSYITVKFNPIEIVTSDSLWESYDFQCCSIIFNSSKCSLSNNCLNILNNWLYLSNTSETILTRCCYYLGSFDLKSNLKNFTSPYCDKFCLLHT